MYGNYRNKEISATTNISKFFGKDGGKRSSSWRAGQTQIIHERALVGGGGFYLIKGGSLNFVKKFSSLKWHVQNWNANEGD